MSNSSFERPREIITFCLKPFEDQKGTTAYDEAFRRLEHVIRTYSRSSSRRRPRWRWMSPTCRP